MFEFQPTLQNELVKLEPLKETDFERIFEVASDPLIWEQHPNPLRYQREHFEKYFKGAMESGGAFIIYENENSIPIGCTRFYDYFPDQNQVTIGYTFFGRNYWGKGHNKAAKTLMLNHAFEFVEFVKLQIGMHNLRSQKAIEKLGAKKINEENVAYFGEKSVLNFIYLFNKTDWKLSQ